MWITSVHGCCLPHIYQRWRTSCRVLNIKAEEDNNTSRCHRARVCAAGFSPHHYPSSAILNTPDKKIVKPQARGAENNGHKLSGINVRFEQCM